MVDVRDGEVIWDEHTRIPVRPMVGVIATAPELDSISTIDNGPHGGNLDVQEMGPGCRVFLPIAAEGAYFYLGDCHAVQGDGELCGIGAIEIRTQTTVRLDLVPKPARMVWPRIETDEHIGAVACARPLEDAFRLATEELVNWMVDDYGFRRRALCFCSARWRRPAARSSPTRSTPTSRRSRSAISRDRRATPAVEAHRFGGWGCLAHARLDALLTRAAGSRSEPWVPLGSLHQP